MPRKKSPHPAYQFHVSGQAVVRLDYKDFYLGKHGSPESWAKYYALLAEYNSNGMKAPAGTADGPEYLGESKILVSHIVADFRARVIPSFNPVREKHFQKLCKLLEDRFGDVPADEFGPLKLQTVRDGMVAKGNCRKYVNESVRNLVFIISHGVSRELIGPERIVALESLVPLKRAQCKDNPRRKGVSDELIDKTLPQLRPVLQAMVKLQRLTACRPGELHTLTPSLIDRSGPIWFIRPDHHKTEHHGKARSIPLVPEAVQILQPYLFAGDDEPCFTNREGKPWNKDQYRRSIVRACDRAKIQRWSPYQIRRTAGQKVRDAMGVEFSQALYGHSRSSTTDIYTSAAEQKAIEAAKVLASSHSA